MGLLFVGVNLSLYISDQEERRRTTRQIAMDKKMQENNDDLAKALGW